MVPVNNPAFEMLKSIARFLWFGFLALVVTALTALLSDSVVTNAVVVVAGQSVQVGFLLVTVIGVAIKALDRYIHLNENIKLNGLAPAVLQK